MDPSNEKALIFHRNNTAIRIIAPILCVEQLLYALLLSPPESIFQQLYFSTSALLMIITILSYTIKSADSFPVSWMHEYYSLGILLLGMGIALVRILAHEGVLYGIPTIYLAILYGGAVVLIVPYYQSALLYGGISVAAVLLVPSNNKVVPDIPIRADLMINGLIAWVVSAMNYRNFRRLNASARLIAQKNRELQNLSQRDWLTGLYNRRRVDFQLEQIHRYASIILLDLDHFKQINDSYGHHRGDEVLKEISQLLETHIGEDDLCSRWGGEEFLILSSQPGEPLAEQLRSSIASSSFSNGLTLTASFGVVSCNEASDQEALLITVDRRLYQAKELGRNRVVSQATDLSRRQG